MLLFLCPNPAGPFTIPRWPLACALGTPVHQSASPPCTASVVTLPPGACVFASADLEDSSDGESDRESGGSEDDLGSEVSDGSDGEEEEEDLEDGSGEDVAI